MDNYDATETPERGRRRGARLWAQPELTAETRGLAAHELRRDLPAGQRWPAGSSTPTARMRQNALRQLIATSPDLQTS